MIKNELLAKQYESINSLLWYRNGYYELYEDGAIEHKGILYDKDWLWLGLVKKLPFGRISQEIIPRSECIKMTHSELYYKNGKPKYYVIDINRGTSRIWLQ